MLEHGSSVLSRSRRKVSGLNFAAAAASILALSISGFSSVAAFAEPGKGESKNKTDQTAPAYIAGQLSPLEIQHEKSTDAPRPIFADKSALTKDDGDASDHQRPSAPADKQRAFAAAESCASADFANLSGAALVAKVKGSTTSCINTLFNTKGADAAKLFSEAQMSTIAQAFLSNASSYAGDNRDSAVQLVLFLRAGYYVQFYQSATVGTYSPALKEKVGDALNAFFNSPQSNNVNDANGEILSEAVTLIDSAELNARFIPVIKRLLNGYNQSYNASWWMLNAVNNTFTVLFRGHQVPEFVTSVQQDPSLIDTVHAFAKRNISVLATDNSYLVSNAGRELGRFLSQPALKARTKPLVIDLLSKSQMVGETAPLWVGLAEMTSYYDAANCADYGTCNLETKLRAAVLSQERQCSTSIKFVTQAVSDAEYGASCTSLTGQDSYFHAVAKDPGPVANDKNTSIDVVVFDSSKDYQTYAGAIFGIDTNNGGMYLEGDPAVAGNRPVFIAYEAEWQKPNFQIWNLNHEYTHYLDGRFNMYGDFGANITTPTIWWVEGFAEYISYGYRGEPYTAAQTAAATGAYKLSQLFDTTYDHDTERIYRWGYLAANFMINKHPQELKTVLGYYRTGAWTQARSYLKNSIGTTYDAEFAQFLTTCAAGKCEPVPPVPGDGGGTPENPETPCDVTDPREVTPNCARAGLSGTAGSDNHFYIKVPAGTKQLTIKTSGGTGNADVYYNPWGWASSTSHNDRSTGTTNSETIVIPNPPAGYNYIDVKGKDNFTGLTLQVSY